MVFLAARPDFGFGNPNTAAAFFALLAVGVWGFYFLKCPEVRRFPGFVFWGCLLLSTTFGGLIVATASRGGLVALVAGLSGCWIAAGAPRTNVRRLFGLLAAVVILAGMAMFGRMGIRVAGSSLEDGSITSRLTIYGTVPALMVAAPGGWGRGNAAEAYQNWFQDKSDTRIYKHLVSTHATWLVEMGWGLRLGYVLGWVAVLLLCWGTPAAFGVCVTFGVAGIFSHVGLDWRLWVLPVGAGVWAVARRVTLARWPSRWTWALSAVAGGMVLGAMAFIGYWQAPMVRFYGDHLIVGKDRPTLLFFAPDPAVLGHSYGKLVREQGAVGVFWGTGLPTGMDAGRLVLSGNVKDIPNLKGAYDVVWLNPPGRLSEVQRKVVAEAGRKLVLWGELRTDASSRDLKPWIKGLPGGEWQEIPGAGLLLWRVPELSR